MVITIPPDPLSILLDHPEIHTSRWPLVTSLLYFPAGCRAIVGLLRNPHASYQRFVAHHHHPRWRNPNR